MDNFNKELLFSLETGFVEQAINSKTLLQPMFVTNDKNRGAKVLSYILNRIEVCDEFWFSSAFLTTSGVAVLHNSLKKFSQLDKGIGHIFVSDYLTFTQPEALKRIKKFQNIDVRLLRGHDFHGKTYLFKIGNQFDCLVGSSNLTAAALSKNNELNIHFCATAQSKLVNNFMGIFENYFEAATPVTDGLISEYNDDYMNQMLVAKSKSGSEFSKQNEDSLALTETVNPEIIQQQNTKNHEFQTEHVRPIFYPNLLQREATESIEKLRNEGNDRALVISATGTGKTVLSAFDVQNFQAKRLLFVVHRYNIAAKAMSTFKEIFGSSRSMGMYSGQRLETNCDFIFSTVQTINNDRHLNNFARDDFDYIIIDETHRAGAKTYQKILDYFSPKFLLGMTATPERTDGYDIFSLFNHKVGCEIRLHRAMDEDLLCPFHYFGITDLVVDGQPINELSDFNQLISSQRVDHIIDAIEEYGCDIGIARGLVFCSRTEEAKILSLEFNNRGFKTVALTGESSDRERANAIERIESTNASEKIEYIFTVDIFNEGIDIPSLNQIIMLRPTQSAIIFVQQLGRGLRKSENKEYVTVIDFIGNYRNNYLIPVALYGDRSLNKDSLRRLLNSGSNLIPGSSTVNFDEITKEKIFESINATNLQTKKDLSSDYNLLKFRIGRCPMMMDFLETQSRDPYQYVEYSRSFYNFSLLEETEEQLIRLPDYEKTLIEHLTKYVNNGVRGLESLLLLELIQNTKISECSLSKKYYELTKSEVDQDTIFSAFNCLNLMFHQERPESTYSPVGEIYSYEIATFRDNVFRLGNTLKTALNSETFTKYLVDSTEYSITTFSNKLAQSELKGGFIRYGKYTRVDAIRVLNWKTYPVPLQNVGGYKVSDDKKTCPIFVTYKKSGDISETTMYEDAFLSPDEFSWMSRSKRTLSSSEVVSIISQAQNGIRLPLFIKKSDDEGQEHYFVGDLSLIQGSPKQQTMQVTSGSVPIVNIQFTIDKTVEEGLYRYLTS